MYLDNNDDADDTVVEITMASTEAGLLSAQHQLLMRWLASGMCWLLAVTITITMISYLYMSNEERYQKSKIFHKEHAKFLQL